MQTLPFNFFHWKLATITPCRLPAIAQRFPDMVFDGLPKVAIKRQELKSSHEKRRERKFIMTPELLRIPELGNIQIRVDSVTRVTSP